MKELLKEQEQMNRFAKTLKETNIINTTQKALQKHFNCKKIIVDFISSGNYNINLNKSIINSNLKEICLGEIYYDLNSIHEYFDGLYELNTTLGKMKFLIWELVLKHYYAKSQLQV